MMHTTGSSASAPVGGPLELVKTMTIWPEISAVQDEYNAAMSSVASLVERCVARVSPTKFTFVGDRPLELMNTERRYGLSSVSQVGSHAYSGEPAEDHVYPSDVAELLVGKTTGEHFEYTNLAGEEFAGQSYSKGCIDEGIDGAFGGRERRQSLTQRTHWMTDLLNRSYSTLIAGTWWAEQVRRWSECMDTAGFTGLTDPTRISQPLTDEEAVSRADVACNTSINLAEQAFQAESDIINQLLAEHPEWDSRLKVAAD